MKIDQTTMRENDEKKICNNIAFPNRAKKPSYFLKNK